MTVSTADSATTNNCYITTQLDYDNTTVTWQTTSVQVRIRVRFTCTVPVTDSSNSLSISGSASGTWTNALNINYSTGTFLILDTYQTVSLTNSTQTFTLNTSLAGINYAGVTMTITNQSLTIMARPPSISQPTYNYTSLNTGTTLTVTTNRQNSNFQHIWYYQSPSGVYYQIGTGITLSANYLVTAATFGPMMTDTATRAFNFLLETYDGVPSSNTYIGGVNTSITVTMEAGAVPTITSVTAAESAGTANVNTIVGAFVKSLSKLTVNVNGGAGVYGSTIAKTEVIVGGVAVTGNPVTTDYLQSSGSVTITGRVTDTRGRTATKDLVVTVLDYSVPNISAFNVLRCDSLGNLLTTGTYGKSTTNATVKSLVNGTEKNTLTYTIQSRQRGTTPWTTQRTGTLAVGTVILANVATIGAGAFSAVNSYEFQVLIADKFNTTVALYVMSVAAVTMSLGQNRVGIGKVGTQGALDVAGDTYTSGSFYENGTPISLKYQPNQNYILNGGFEIWQRGTSFAMSAVVADVWCADRWVCYRSSVGSGMVSTISQQAFTLGAAPTAGYEAKYFLRWDVTTAGTGFTALRVEQRIEDARTLAGRQVTVSFWAKSARSTTLSSVALCQMFGSGGSANVDTTFVTNLALTTGWVRYSYTATLPSVAGKIFGAGDYLSLLIYIPPNALATLDLWGVKVESGPVATPFTRNGSCFAAELAACQRYHYRYDAVAGGASTNARMAEAAYIRTGDTLYCNLHFPVTMRVAPPSFNSSNASTFLIVYSSTSIQANSISYQSATQNMGSYGLTCAGAPLTIGQIAQIERYASANPCFIEYSAEL